jgi:hypothetical protein
MFKTKVMLASADELPMNCLGELPRISLPRTRVNKGIKKGRGCYAPPSTELRLSTLFSFLTL